MRPGSVLLNSPVNAIYQIDNGCLVETTTGLKIKCRKVILANPTNTYKNIHFTPPLPEAKRALVSRTKAGIYAKVILTYKIAWWKDLGLVGKFFSFVGPICFSWDVSDTSAGVYSLALFVAGAIAEKWQALESLAREEAIISHLAQLIGEDNAHLAHDVVEVNSMEWAKEEWLEGAPTSAMQRLSVLYQILSLYDQGAPQYLSTYPSRSILGSLESTQPKIVYEEVGWHLLLWNMTKCLSNKPSICQRHLRSWPHLFYKVI
jgi:monoamine oxidase